VDLLQAAPPPPLLFPLPLALLYARCSEGLGLMQAGPSPRRAELLRAPPPLVLSGHAAFLTPY